MKLKRFFTFIVFFCSICNIMGQKKGDCIDVDNVRYFVDEVEYENGLKYYLVHEWERNYSASPSGDAKDNFRGVIIDGKLTVPCKYATIHFLRADESDNGCFEVSRYHYGKCCNHGAYTRNGNYFIHARGEGSELDIWTIERVRDEDNNQVVTRVKYKNLLSYGEYYVNDCGERCICLKEQCVDKFYDTHDDLIYYLIKDDTLYGIMDKSKNWVIKPRRYNYLSPFQYGDKFFFVCKQDKQKQYGLLNEKGEVVYPTEFDGLEYIGGKYLKFKLNGYYGVMTLDGQTIIPTSRGYTAIGKYVSSQQRFSYTMSGYKGECDETGKQLSKIKVEASEVPNTSNSSSTASGTTTSSSSGSSSNSTTTSSTNSNTQSNTTTQQTIVVEHHRDPQPMQVWHQCTACYGSGTCKLCGGNGWNPYSYANGRYDRCLSCGGRGKCSYCAGQGGHYEVEYR